MIEMKYLFKSILFLTTLLTTIPLMGQQKTVIVGSGETFETIANKYGVSLAELQAANPKKKVC